MESKKFKRRAIIIGILSASVVIIVLGLGLGLGLRQKKEPEPKPDAIITSCRNICFEPHQSGVLGCRCDDKCNSSSSCCHDYYDLCVAPTVEWECTRIRCGEKKLNPSNCHCSTNQLDVEGRCANFREVCYGETAWADSECANPLKPLCPGSKRPPLLLVSLDGLRSEYMQSWSALTPNLAKLIRCGSSASYMQSSFPTKTFPNHYTIVTGLYPESNGLIDNSMFDPVFNTSFSLSSDEKLNPAWYLGQPIWHTAQYQGLKSGTFFWPGSDVEINGSYPNLYKPYDGDVPFEERVHTVLQWLLLPDDQRPDFFTLYLEEPDKAGHSYGPTGGGLLKSLMYVDKIIGQLMNGIKQVGHEYCLNIIVLADHGMEEMSCERKEVLQDLVGDIGGYWVYEGPFGRVRSTNKDKVWDPAGLVANMTCKKPDQKIKPYLKADLPKRLHFANSRRIEDVSVLVDPKWLFERYPGSLTFCSGGNHGWDNDVESMHAMFVAYGPKFVAEQEIEPFSNVELYNVMCDVLEISPVDNNGTRGSMNHILRNPFYTPQHPAEQSPPAQCPLISLDPADNLGCSCPNMTLNATILNERLNLTAEEAAAAETRHMPFGRPRMLQSDQSYCVLHQEGFVSAYGHKTLMPLWSSFTVEKPTNLDPLPLTADCLRADVRLPASQSPSCNQYNAVGNLTYAFLYPPNLNMTENQEFDALTMSNVVPMYPEFKKIWDYFQNTLLKKYASIYNTFNMVTGPVFDYNYDGRFDAPEQIVQFVNGTSIPIPTHYFAVLTHCKLASEPVTSCSSLQTVSFLLPHRPDNRESCKSAGAESDWVEDHMWFHQARVRDVEWITGLDFYQDSNMNVTDVLRLKTFPTAAIKRRQ